MNAHWRDIDPWKKKNKKNKQALDIAALILEQCAARGQGAKADCWAILKA